MNINLPYNGFKCCPVCATNQETLWMALELAMPLGSNKAPAPQAPKQEREKRPYRMTVKRPSPSYISPEKKEEARRLRAQGVMPIEIARITGINKNSLPKIIQGVRTDPAFRGNHVSPSV